MALTTAGTHTRTPLPHEAPAVRVPSVGRMGKGARNRAKRAKEVGYTAAREAAREAIGELLLVESFEEYVGLLEKHPELGVPEAADELDEASNAPGYGPLFARARLLLDGARSGDLAAAWEAHRKAAEEAQRLVDAVEPLQAEADAAMEAGDYARILEIVDEALPIAVQTGFGLGVCLLLDQRGVALLNSAGPNRADELEGAIEAFRAALEVSVSGAQAAGVLMHLGLAFGERIHGDRADNIETALAALDDALAELDGSPDQDDELRAMILTNLSVFLGRSEREDRVGVAREAVDLCREALCIRSPERDADDWAYSQLNLGQALRDLSGLGEGDAAEARAAFQAVLDHAGGIRNPTLVGSAHQALGDMDLASTRWSPEDYVDAHEAGTLDEEPDPTPALQAARAHLEAAKDLIRNDPIRRARVLHSLSETLDSLGESDAAVEAEREALTVLRPTTVPDGCKDAASHLGSLLAQREDWQGAAAAMREAVEAAGLAFHARLDASSREREARSTGNLHRWAAYAIARAGDARGAAVVLDAGRGREIGRRLGSDSVLDGVPASLRADYQTAVQALASSPLGSDTTGASRQLQGIIAAIREIPGHERFGAGPSWEELVPAVEPGWPLIYVNPAPTGTMLLVLSPDNNADGPTAEARFIETTSNDVFLRLITGDGAEPDAGDDDGASYLFSLGGSGEPDLRTALDQVLPWLGEAIARPIAEELGAHGATGATLILCGPLGLAPLHAAPWQGESQLRCLADEFEIRFAPSAVVCGVALRRAARERPARLIALADPQGDLPAARPEAVEIAALFGSANSEVAVGPDADADFLRRHAARTTYLHLACMPAAVSSTPAKPPSYSRPAWFRLPISPP
jgi:tetratricopeptide (TPR) repeat protein